MENLSFASQNHQDTDVNKVHDYILNTELRLKVYSLYEYIEIKSFQRNKSKIYLSLIIYTYEITNL